MPHDLTIAAGPDVLEQIRDEGLRTTGLTGLVGASGGPKWLALHGIDRVLFEHLRSNPPQRLHVLASSIGAWRFACLAQENPLQAQARLEDAYIGQRYPPKPPPSLVSLRSRDILDALLGPGGSARIVDHPWLRTHIVTARARHLFELEGRAQLLGLGLAVGLNLASRRALRWALERVVFCRPDRSDDPFGPWRDVPTRHVPLTHANVVDALMATASIPMVLAGVRNPAGAPRGVYRDGGIIDYHFGPEIDPAQGYVLYPHFYPHLTPGWFDKGLSWRRTRGLRRVVLVSPSPRFVARLPGGKIPDRTDFELLSDAERIDRWRRVVREGERLADAFAELLSGRALGDQVVSLT